MKRVYVLQCPDGTFWTGYSKPEDPTEAKYFHAVESAEKANHEICNDTMTIRSLRILVTKLDEVTQYA